MKPDLTPPSWMKTWRPSQPAGRVNVRRYRPPGTTSGKVGTPPPLSGDHSKGELM